MSAFFLFLAVVGGTIAVLQVVGSVLGMGGQDEPNLHGEHGIDGNHPGAVHSTALDAFHFRSPRAIAAGIGFAGLGGLLALRQFGSAVSLTLALLLGVSIYFFVAFVMRGFTRMEADGSVNLEHAVGLDAVVSLPISGVRTAPGKVRLIVGGRQVEWPAVQSEAAPADSMIPAGARVQIIDVLDGSVLTVVALP